MRAVAACQFTLSRFGLWRVFVVGLTASALLALLAWLMSHAEAIHAGVWTACGLVAVACTWLGWSQARARLLTLRWDGQRWHLGTGQVASLALVPGDLRVILDFGGWMLLRFQADTTVRFGAGTTWLPAQRRGLEQQWHALRCAVYSPRPAGDANVAVEL